MEHLGFWICDFGLKRDPPGVVVNPEPESKIQSGDRARAATGSIGPLELDHISSAGAMALRLSPAMSRGSDWILELAILD
jgi:hypothetical protein